MRRIRKLLNLVSLSLLLSVSAYGQSFPVTLTVDSKSPVAVQSPPTKQGFKYRVTVQGTYSQWPQFADCRGVDAVWVYDVPQEEIDELRWPPKEVAGSPFVEIPHWVGDTTEYAFPPSQVGVPPMFTISFRRYLGFRIDGEPLPALPLDSITHRYQVERRGTGDPLSFVILDSAYSLFDSAAVARYDDNCGVLTVTIEEIPNVDINVCSVEPVVVNGQSIGLRVDAGVFQIDTTTVDGKRNLLSSVEQMGIVVEGKFMCPDSLVCDSVRTTPLSIGLIVDVSGSMQELISYEGSKISRMEAVKRALRELLKSLRKGDEIYISRFNSTVKLVLDWTPSDDLGRIEAAIESLTPTGSTAFHRALIDGINKTVALQSAHRVIIALTDGLNNEEPKDKAVVLDILRKSQIPLYIIGLGFSGKADELVGIESMKEFVAASPKGAYYQITKGDELVNVYRSIAESISTSDCCRLYFKVPPCDLGQSTREMRLLFLHNGAFVTRTIQVPCARVVSVRDGRPTRRVTKQEISSSPVPADEVATVTIDLPRATSLRLQLFDINGQSVYSHDYGIVDMGRFKADIPVDDLSSGVYLCRLTTDRAVSTTRIVVTR